MRATPGATGRAFRFVPGTFYKYHGGPIRIIPDGVWAAGPISNMPDGIIGPIRTMPDGAIGPMSIMPDGVWAAEHAGDACRSAGVPHLQEIAPPKTLP